MAQPYVGEIRMFAGNFAPAGWMFCEGQLLAISGNDTLYNLIGTTYGGDGESTFALPDLRGRIPLHQGNNVQLAETGGTESVTLTTQQVPGHTHALLGSTDIAQQSGPTNQVLARTTAESAYGGDTPFGSMSPSVVSSVGGSQPHSNMQPYLCVNFIISLFGLFPSQT